MRSPLLAMTLLAAFATHPARAAENEFQITPRAGTGDLRINAFEGVNDQLVDSDTLGLGCAFGYLTPIGILAEIGADSYGQWDLFDAFDSFSLSQRFVAVGYQFELGNGWRFVPKAGRARWKLHSDEGRLFHPGPEAENEVRGYGYYWEASVSRRISRVVALGVTYKQGNYDFGRSRTTAFLVTLGF